MNTSRSNGPRREPPRLEKHLSIKDAAALVGVPGSTFRSWVLQGHLPSVKLPGAKGRRLVKESDVASFLERLRQPAYQEVLDRALGYSRPHLGRPPRGPVAAPRAPDNGTPAV